MESMTVREVVHRANVLGKDKVKRPVECYTNLFVKAGQFAQVNRPPHPPSHETGKIETEDARHPGSTTN